MSAGGDIILLPLTEGWPDTDGALPSLIVGAEVGGMTEACAAIDETASDGEAVAVMAGAGAALGPETWGTVFAEVPARHVEQAALTTVVDAGGAVSAAAAALLAASIPDALAMFAIEGIAAAGAARVVEPDGQEEQASVAV